MRKWDTLKLDEETRDKVEEIASESGLDVEVYIAWWDNDFYTEWEDIDNWHEKVEENYIGEFFNTRELAEHMEEQGILDLSGIPKQLQYYFDYESYGRDLELGGDVWSMDFHYFWNN
jgi:antirestriction protein